LAHKKLKKTPQKVAYLWQLGAPIAQNSPEVHFYLINYFIQPTCVESLPMTDQNFLALENISVALTREIGDGPCFLYTKFSWIGVSLKMSKNPIFLQFFEYSLICGHRIGLKMIKFCRNVSTTPLQQWGFRQCLPFSWTTLRGKHCRYPIAVMGVVDTFRLCT
jgi:hypothetical protein